MCSVTCYGSGLALVYSLLFRFRLAFATKATQHSDTQIPSNTSRTSTPAPMEDTVITDNTK